MRVLIFFLLLTVLAGAEPIAFVWRFGETPRHAPVSDGQRFLVLADNFLWAGSLPDGRLLWKVPTEGYWANPPVLAGDRVLLRDSGSLRAISWPDGKVLWRRDSRPFMCDGKNLWVEGLKQIDLQTGEELQSVPMSGLPLSPYFWVRNDKELLKIDPGTGQVTWRRPAHDAGIQQQIVYLRLGKAVEYYDAVTGQARKAPPPYRPATQLNGPGGWSLRRDGVLYRSQQPAGRFPCKLYDPSTILPAQGVGVIGPNLVGWGSGPTRVTRLAQPALQSLHLDSLMTPGRQTVYLSGYNLGRVKLRLEKGGQTVWSRQLNLREQGYGSGNVELLAKEPGAYTLVAEAPPLRREQALTVTRLGTVCKYSPEQVDVFVYDFVAGRPAPGVKVEVEKQTQTTNADGLARFTLDLSTTTEVRIGNLKQTVGWEKPPGLGQLYVRSDRPLYRPGHKVEFFALCLKRRELAPGQNVTVELRDPSDNLLQTLALTSDEKGLVAGSFLLSDEAPLGRYRLACNCPELSANQSLPLEVQAYKKPPFELKLSTPQPLYLQGQSVPVQLSSQYFFGGAVGGTRIKMVVTSSPLYYDPAPSPDYEPTARSGYYGGTVWQGEVVTDAEGKAVVQVPTTRDESDQLYTLSASAVGGEGQPVEATLNWTASVARYGIYVQPLGWVHSRGAAIPVRVHAVDRTGKPFSVPFKLTVGKRSLNGHTDALGQALVQFPVRQEGYLEIQVTSRDSGGRLASDYSSVWVGEGGYTAGELELVPGRRTVKPGGTLDLLVLSSQPGHLWLTIEGRKVFWQKVVKLTRKATRLSLPIDRNWEGNLQVRAVTPGDDYAPSASVQVKVSGQPGRLDLKVEPDRPDYRPGRTATLKVQSGRPSALVVSLVDEALYKLRSEFAPNLYSAVHATPHLVEQVTLMPRKGRAAGFQTIEPPVQVRSEFKDTAFWKVGILTDEQGQAEVAVPLPHNLTRWRGIVQGFSLPPGGLEVGQTQTSLVTRLPLSVRTIVPRFAVEGDEFEARGLVNNQLTEPVTVATEIQATPGENLEVAPQQTKAFARRLQVAPYDGQPLRVTTRVIASALQESDAERQELPVLAFGSQHRESLSAMISQPAEYTVEVPKDVRQARLEVRLSPSLMDVVAGSLDYLADYPYGCVEQTMSRFGPTLVAAQAARKLGLPLHKPVDKMVAAGLQKLYGFQHSDGGWGWWVSDATHPYMTGYVLAGLVDAQKAGYTVDPEVLTRAIQCTERLLKEDRDQDVRVYLAWALTRAGRTPTLEDNPKLSVYGQALLLQAAVLQKQATLADTMARRLEGLASGQPAHTAPTHLRGPSSEGTLHWKAQALRPHGFLDDDVEATCQVLRGLLALNPQDPRLLNGLAWVLENRRGAAWKTTKDTACVVYLLSEYLQAVPPTAAGAPTLSVDGKAQEVGRVQVLPLQAGQSSRVQIQPAGSLSSASLMLRYFDPSRSTQLEAQPGADFRIFRRYYRGRQQLFAPLQLKPQDEVTVQLEIHCDRPLEYVMVQDYRAAGMEPVAQPDADRWAQREDRDDRSVFFFTQLAPGRHTLRYTQRAQTPGRYRVLPALLEEMYEPDGQSRSGSDEVIIQ